MLATSQSITMRVVMVFSEIERDIVYKVIFNRRDVRGQFKPDPVPEDVLIRILTAAHHAPSVGFMQPWDFIVVKDPDVKRLVKEGFEIANKEAANMFQGDRKEFYKSLKLEGIMEAPVGICITCDRARTGPVVIGRTANPEMDLYSSVCAVQNLWLAARAENLGVGWVSIIHHEALREALKIPQCITPIAYLCVGYVTFFHEKPELEKAGWLPRANISSLIHYNQWRSDT
jgi:5,6-dimethylbenzimidazole synthase